MLDIFVDRSPNYIVDFVFDACEYLDMRYLYGTVLVTPEKDFNDGSTCGSCSSMDGMIDLLYAENVSGKRVSRKTKLLTIAHELVHARQHLSGELVRGANNRSIWYGLEYDDDDFESPWEREAYRLEKEIYEHCRKERYDIRDGDWV